MDAERSHGSDTIAESNATRTRPAGGTAAAAAAAANDGGSSRLNSHLRRSQPRELVITRAHTAKKPHVVGTFRVPKKTRWTHIVSVFFEQSQFGGGYFLFFMY